MNLLEALRWRYATKNFDITKKISSEDIGEIIEAFRLTPSSFWLQPWKLIHVKNQLLREELLPHSWNQSQIVQASDLFVLARVENAGDDLVDLYIEDIMKKTWASKEDISGYEQMMKWFLWNLDTDQKNAWADRQVMIASGILMSFLAVKGIDSCPMEGFDRVKYDEILWLKEKWLSSVLVLPVWYRNTDDKYAQKPKVRFESQDLLLTYE